MVSRPGVCRARRWAWPGCRGRGGARSRCERVTRGWALVRSSEPDGQQLQGFLFLQQIHVAFVMLKRCIQCKSRKLKPGGTRLAPGCLGPLGWLRCRGSAGQAYSQPHGQARGSQRPTPFFKMYVFITKMHICVCPYLGGCRRKRYPLWRGAGRGRLGISLTSHWHRFVLSETPVRYHSVILNNPS